MAFFLCFVERYIAFSVEIFLCEKLGLLLGILYLCKAFYNLY